MLLNASEADFTMLTSDALSVLPHLLGWSSSTSEAQKMANWTAQSLAVAALDAAYFAGVSSGAYIAEPGDAEECCMNMDACTHALTQVNYETTWASLAPPRAPPRCARKNDELLGFFGREKFDAMSAI